MKKTLLCILTIISFILNSGAQCNGDRYRNFITADFDLTSDVLYGSNTNQDGTPEDLMMDVYEPSGDNETNRALIIVCHGGFFLGGDKAGSDVVELCRDLAKLGFVVASINYRLGIEIANPLQVPYGQAVVRAVQDLRASIRWFRKNAEEDGNTYGIDTNHIFVGGDSAGGFMALHHAYMDESDIPAWLDMAGIGMEGGMEGESGNPGYSSDVKAIYSVSGALGDYNWIGADDTTPACLFHGDNDQTVTIDSDMFVLFNILDVTEIDGSNPINTQMDELGIEHCYHITQGGGHVPYQGNAAVYDTTLSIISNFFSYYICDVALDCDYREITTEVDESTTNFMTLYPNPAAAGTTLSFGRSFKNARYTLCDFHGKVIEQATVNGSMMKVPEGLSAGIYLIKIMEGENLLFQKLVIE